MNVNLVNSCKFCFEKYFRNFISSLRKSLTKKFVYIDYGIS